MSLLTRSKGRTAAGASGSSSDQPWSPMFRAQSSAGTRCEQTANLNVLVRCLPTASPLPPQNRTSARPAGSSAVRLHHFRKHTEGDHGRSWHLSAVPTAPSNVGFSNRPFRVKRFQTIHHYSVDVAHGLVLLFGIGTRGPSIMGFEDEVEQSIGRFNGCGAVRLGRSSRRGLTT